MRAVEILAEEHRDIACVLACLEQQLQETVCADSLDGEAAGEILEYLERVADGSHQDKEEKLVFPRLLERTTADVRHSVERLQREHESERHALERLRTNLEGAAYGDALSRDSFVSIARAYVAKLREHARWEEEFLLPLAEDHLAECEDAEMLAGYRAVEERYFADACRGPRKLLERIHVRFGVLEGQVPLVVGAE